MPGSSRSTITVSTVSTPSLTYSTEDYLNYEDNDYQEYNKIAQHATPSDVPVQVSNYFNGPHLRTNSAVTTTSINNNPLFDRLTPKSSTMDSLERSSSETELLLRVKARKTADSSSSSHIKRDTKEVLIKKAGSKAPSSTSKESCNVSKTRNSDTSSVSSRVESLQSTPGRSEFSFKSPSNCACSCRCGVKQKSSELQVVEEEHAVGETSELESTDDKTRGKKGKIRVRRRKVDETTETDMSYYYDSSDKLFAGSYGRCYGSCDVTSAEQALPNSGKLLAEVNMCHFRNVESSGTISKSVNDLGLASDVVHPEQVVELERGGHYDLWKEKSDWVFGKYIPLYTSAREEEITTSMKNDMLKYFGKNAYASKSLGSPSREDWKGYLEWKATNAIQFDNLKSTSPREKACVEKRTKHKVAAREAVVSSSSNTRSTSISSLDGVVLQNTSITCVVKPTGESRQTNVHMMMSSSEELSVDPVPLICQETTVVTTTTNDATERTRLAKEARKKAEEARVLQKKADKKYRLRMRNARKVAKKTGATATQVETKRKSVQPRPAILKGSPMPRTIHEVRETTYRTSYSCNDEPPKFHRPLYLDSLCTIPLPQKGDPNRLELLTLSSNGKLSSRSSLGHESRKVMPHRPVTTTTPYHGTGNVMASPIVTSSTIASPSLKPKRSTTETPVHIDTLQGGSTTSTSTLIPGGRFQSYLNTVPNGPPVYDYVTSLHRGSSSEPIRGQSWMYNYNSAVQSDEPTTGYSIKTVAVVDGENVPVTTGIGCTEYSIPTKFMPVAVQANSHYQPYQPAAYSSNLIGNRSYTPGIVTSTTETTTTVTPVSHAEGSLISPLSPCQLNNQVPSTHSWVTDVVQNTSSVQ